MTELVPMSIKGLMLDPVSNSPIVVLKDEEEKFFLPIWVGIFEANAIAIEMEKVTTPRPMTHDLLRNVLKELETKVERIVINDLRDNTFFAVIEMSGADGESVRLDSRPSDAIALALRADCPIFVDSEVIQASKNSVSEDEQESESETGEEEWPDVIGDASDLPM